MLVMYLEVGKYYKGMYGTHISLLKIVKITQIQTGEDIKYKIAYRVICDANTNKLVQLFAKLFSYFMLGDEHYLPRFMEKLDEAKVLVVEKHINRLEVV